MKILAPWFKIIDIEAIWKKFKRYRVEKKEHPIINQQEANELYEGTDFMPADRVSENLLIFYFTMFILPQLPTAPIYTMIGLVINYQIDKYFLVNNCKRPEYLSGEFAYAMIFMIGYGWT